VAIPLDDIEPPDDIKPLDDFEPPDDFELDSIEEDRGGAGEAVRLPGVTSCADRCGKGDYPEKQVEEKEEGERGKEERWSMVKCGLRVLEMGVGLIIPSESQTVSSCPSRCDPGASTTTIWAPIHKNRIQKSLRLLRAGVTW
jgi:hypothetical protein